MTLVQDLSMRERARLDADTPRRTVRVGQVVWQPSRPVEVLFGVRSGRFRLYRRLPDGRQVTTALPSTGSLFGEMPLLGLRMRTTWAEALEAGELCLMSRHDVSTMLLGDPRIATRIAEQLGCRIGELEERLVDLVGKSVCQRVAHTLLLLTSEDGRTVRLTHAQLALLVGATRERTTLVLGELAAGRLVSLHRGRIVIRDRSGLGCFAGDSTG